VWSTISQHERQSLLRSSTITVDKTSSLLSSLLSGKSHDIPPPPRLSLLEESRLKEAKRTLGHVFSSLQDTRDIHVKMQTVITQQRLLGLEIPDDMGGCGGSPYFHGRVLTFLASADDRGEWIHRIMVPNSLGPAQLIMKYGTPEQKTEYLPKIARGELIPCFGLTGPWNGSDAGAIRDEAKIIQRGETDYLVISCEKRWITLSPEAHLLGLAVRINGKISLVMIDRTRLTPEENQRITIRRHSPIGSHFPNGHIVISDLEIPLETSLIGGSSQIGNGWVMLMECLQHGRGISLPSVSDGGSRHVMWHTLFYSLTRRQFGQCLWNIPAVQSMIADMTMRVFLGHILVTYYHALLQHDQEHSSALTAVMKWVMTTWHREVVMMGMDIFAGKGITLGPKNPIARYYLNSPIPITVEGSNTLTQHVIIPVQSLFEHHDDLRKIVFSLETNDIRLFYSTIGSIATSIGTNIVKTLTSSSVSDKQSARLALSAYVALLYGTNLRKRQDVCGRLGQHIAGCVVLTSLDWYKKHNDIPPFIAHLCENFILRWFFHSHGSRSMMYHEVPHDVRNMAQLFLDHEYRSHVLEQDLFLDSHSEATGPLLQVRDLWRDTTLTPEQFSESIIPVELQRQVIDVDSL
jgi:acyl-CoA dehydrogenase